MEVSAIAGLDLKFLAEKVELLVHAGREHADAVDFVVRHQRNHPLLDLNQLLPGADIKHFQVITDMEEFAANLEDGIACLVADYKSFGEAPGSFLDMVAHGENPPVLAITISKIGRQYSCVDRQCVKC